MGSNFSYLGVFILENRIEVEIILKGKFYKKLIKFCIFSCFFS